MLFFVIFVWASQVLFKTIRRALYNIYVMNKFKKKTRKCITRQIRNQRVFMVLIPYVILACIMNNLVLWKCESSLVLKIMNWLQDYLISLILCNRLQDYLKRSTTYFESMSEKINDKFYI